VEKRRFIEEWKPIDAFLLAGCHEKNYFYSKLKTTRMETNKHSDFHRHLRVNNFMFAAALVAAGAVILGHNLKYITDDVYHILISWPMIPIVLGLAFLIKRNLVVGVILLLAGSYFLLPRLPGVGGEWIHTYWPVFLIIVGIALLFRRRKHVPLWSHHWHGKGEKKSTEKVENGFVTIDMSFGSTRQIVLDPVFRGADIDISFGSVVLDLRRTKLEATETYIDIDCSFGGMELLIPSHWHLVIVSDNSFGGYDDKRRLSQEIDYDHRLVIRGDISFSGVEIRD
jgi:hypothetical protein